MALCRDCGAQEGAIHMYGCCNEICPFCDRQLLACGCIYRELRLKDRGTYTAATHFLPPAIYMDGPSEAQEQQWLAILEKKGRVPFIIYPVICAKCGALWPELFKVPDEEWERYIQPNMRKSVICRPCFDLIKNQIEGAAANKLLDAVTAQEIEFTHKMVWSLPDWAKIKTRIKPTWNDLLVFEVSVTIEGRIERACGSIDKAKWETETERLAAHLGKAIMEKFKT